MSNTYRELRASVDALNTAEEAFVKARQAESDAHARVGRALRACRERHDISLRTVAEKMGVSAPYLSDVERGYRTLSSDNLETYMDLVIPSRNMSAGFDAKPQEMKISGHTLCRRCDTLHAPGLSCPT
jgi:tRNA A-37 threonylcarbamoyl transferase component Bud32